MAREYLQVAQDYEDAVIDGEIAAGKWVRLACARNRHDRQRAGTAAFPFTFDGTAARKVCAFAELLPYVTGRGFSEVIGYDEGDLPVYRTFVLQPWQVWILTVMFGWMNAKGLRRFRVGLILVPRKNGKSSMGAIIALYMLTEEREPGAQVFSAATSRDQAKAVADVAWEMCKRSPKLRAHYGVRLGSETTKSLRVPGTNSKFMPLSADAHTLDGLNISCAIVDELHAHKTPSVWNVIDTSTSARLQPYIVAITTAGVDVGGVCHQKLGYLEKILDGVISDETFFGLNYTIDVGDDFKDPAIARKANPNYGISVDPDDIQRKVHTAEHSQETLNDVLTKHFNVWIRSESGWMTRTVWQTCKADDVSLDSLRAYPCWIGVDLGEVRDFSAVVLLFRTAPETYALIPYIYVPEDGLVASPIAGLSAWERQGHVIATPGTEADYQRIEDDLVRFTETLTVKEIDFDRRSARLMIQKIKQRLEPALGRDRVDRFVIDVPQNLETMDPAMKTAERLVVARKLQHDGNEAMAWMIANVVVERNHKDEIYPRKAGGKDSHNKIDGPVAFLTCLSRAMQATEPEPKYTLFVLGGKR